MIIIESLGLPGSGKTFLKKKLIIIEQELKKRRIITLSSDIGVDKIYHSIQNYI